MPMLTFFLNGVLLVAVYAAVRAWRKSQTVLHTYAKRLEELDDSLLQVSKIKKEMQEQQRRLTFAMTQAEQLASMARHGEDGLGIAPVPAAPKRTLN